MSLAAFLPNPHCSLCGKAIHDDEAVLNFTYNSLSGTAAECIDDALIHRSCLEIHPNVKNIIEVWNEACMHTLGDGWMLSYNSDGNLIFCHDVHVMETVLCPICGEVSGDGDTIVFLEGEVLKLISNDLMESGAFHLACIKDHSNSLSIVKCYNENQKGFLGNSWLIEVDESGNYSLVHKYDET